MFLIVKLKNINREREKVGLYKYSDEFHWFYGDFHYMFNKYRTSNLWYSQTVAGNNYRFFTEHFQNIHNREQRMEARPCSLTAVLHADFLVFQSLYVYSK